MHQSLFLLLATALVSQSPADSEPLNDHERAVHLLSRLSFGATPATLAELKARGVDAWLAAQLAAEQQEPDALTRGLAELPSLTMDCGTLVATYRVAVPETATAQERAQREQLRRRPPAETRDAVLLNAVLSANQVREVAADLLRNHLNVSAAKDEVPFVLPDWEREVVRAGALGSFAATLARSAHHPAMLIYLDNAVSRRPPTKVELREIELVTRLRTKSKERGKESAEISRQRGLNENYARELLELHTLGVDNGYQQRDVLELARALTGWSVDLDPENPTGFRFRGDMHCDEDKSLLGRRFAYERKDPQREGEQILAMLGEHPDTARFIAWKLCRWFVTDDPPEDLVARIARSFRTRDGVIGKVLADLVADPEFFARRNYQTKFKRPMEFVVSALRATRAEITSTDALHDWLARLGEPIYLCDDPTGWYDQAEAWCDPGILALRWQFAGDLCAGRIQGVRVAKDLFDGLHPSIPRAWPEQIAARVLVTRIGPTTRAALDRTMKTWLAKDAKPDPHRLGPQLLGLLIAAPEFQRQ